jgi:hypothetical protein
VGRTAPGDEKQRRRRATHLEHLMDEASARIG